MNSGLSRLPIPVIAKFVLIVAMAIAAATAYANPALAARIAIVVNGEAITSGDVQRRVKLLQLQRERGDLKKKAREQLVEEAIKMTEISRLRAAVSDAQVNQSFARFASANKLSSKQLSQMLNQAGVGANHFKEFIRVQMSWPRVVNARFNSGGRMSTEDLVAKMLERGGEKPKTTEYILQQVIFVVPAAKRKSILNSRKREADSMRGRFVSCDSTRQFAKGLRDVSVRDLGRVMQPALPPDWKALIEKTPSGKATATRVTDRGVEFIAICSSREVSDDLAAEMVFRSEQSADAGSRNKNSEKYLKELRERARVIYK
ncbi:peptidylprolyl isomerase [Nitratireductor sp. XY-223]|uniref:SurA N-terminal domain-containing protein n=1 Tax=Nitratireductor sp. XY-223 TaxID=2561926 RepID=UPI0010AB46FA|nr:peptidylprolyl isomerase [Nitratireductor sp. XY-223]